MAEAVDGTPPEERPEDRPDEAHELLPEPVSGPERLPEPASHAELDFPAKRPPPSTFAPRFRMVTGALVGVAVGALAATALLLAGGTTKQHGLAWSRWKPADHGTKDGAEQIARHVGENYRLPTGDQLVLVTGGPLRVAGLDLPVRIAMDRSGGTGSSDSISEVKGRTVMFQLCGLGARCAINKGKASKVRFLLLSREALELALYSFRYLDGVKNVVALLPPSPGQKPENALFFRKSDFEPALDHPLAATLPSPPPTLNALPDSPEASEIQRLTDGQLFRYSFQQSQDLSAFLVLNKLQG